MKKLITITGSFMFMCIIITSIILPSTSKADAKENSAVSTQSVVQNESSIPNTFTESYIVKEYNGKVAAFEKKTGEALYISNVSVSNLPKTDKKLLEEGIVVNSKKELNRLLEDYCS